MENNGYANVAGLKRLFAIRTENYRDKEELLHEVFAKSRIGNTKLFVIDKELIIRLYSVLRGDIIYPKNENAEEIFEKTVKEDIEKRKNRKGDIEKENDYISREELREFIIKNIMKIQKYSGIYWMEKKRLIFLRKILGYLEENIVLSREED